MNIKVKDIYFEDEIYPRKQNSQKTIGIYVEALMAGAVFPPIEVQRIKYPDGEKMVCLDGKHRVNAVNEYNTRIKSHKSNEEDEQIIKLEPITEITANVWKPDDVLDLKENLEELRIRCAVLNRMHGDRLSSNDLAEVVLKIVKARPIDRISGVVSEIAKAFGCRLGYISDLETSEGKLSDILSKRRLSRDFQIWRLIQLGWTQTEVGKAFGLDRSTIGDIAGNFGNEISSIQAQYAKNKSVEEIAQFNNLDLITTWAMILQGKTDTERFENFGEAEFQDDAPRIYNIWNFTKVDSRLGQEHPGRIPGQIALNVLYYYTKQGDMVVDPMAGGGSTIDACLVMGRGCRAYDINPLRKDILKWDIQKGVPEEAKKSDLIFLDPPYWRLEEGLYAKESISSASLDGFMKLMEKIASDSYSALKKGGYVALVIEAFLDEKVTGDFLDLPFKCISIFNAVGFEEMQRIGVPMNSQIKSELDVVRYKKKKVMLDLNRNLIILKKV